MLKKLKTLGGVLLVAILGLMVARTPVMAQVRNDKDDGRVIRIYALSFNPILESQGNQRLSLYKGWTTPSYDEISMVNEITNSINTASQGVVTYMLVGGQILDAIPPKIDNFLYTDATYLNCINNGVGCHTPDDAFMTNILNTYNICSMHEANQFDELWILGGPYMGFKRFMMAGNSIQGGDEWVSSFCVKPMSITTFSYNTSADMRVQNIMHRFAQTVGNAYGIAGVSNTYDLWNVAGMFMAFQGSNPGQTGCGTEMTPPNAPSLLNSIYNLNTNVLSRCNDFGNYPYLTNRYYSTPAWTINCSAWGCTRLGFVNWWLNKIPKYKGRTLTKWDNWWKYFYAYDESVSYNSAANDPKGNFEGGIGSTCRVKGWACDPNKYNQGLVVDFFVGTTQVGSTTASLVREASVQNMCGGYASHGFDYTIPNLHGGNKAIYARVRDVVVGGAYSGMSVTLPTSPQNVNCP